MLPGLERRDSVAMEVLRKAQLFLARRVSALALTGISISQIRKAHSVRMIDRSTDPPVLRLIAGTGERGSGAPGDALKCTMARLHGVFVDTDGAIYVGDSENHRVWVIRKG